MSCISHNDIRFAHPPNVTTDSSSQVVNLLAEAEEAESQSSHNNNHMTHSRRHSMGRQHVHIDDRQHQGC